MFGLVPRKERDKGYPMISFRDEFKPLFDRFFGNWPLMFEPYTEPEFTWGLDMKEEEKEVIVHAELPGFEPAELEIELRDNRLLIRAEKKPAAEEKKPHEFGRYRYERYVELPVPVTPEKVEAKYRNGVLEVHLPKSEVIAAKKIAVK
jgi:HSP20 family protein